jgi:undecaprenyl-diphosphatase
MARFARDWSLVVLLGVLSLLGVAKVGEDVFAHESTAFDDAVQRWVLAHEVPWLVRVFVLVTTIGSVGPMCAFAFAGAGFLWFHGKRRVAATVLLAPVAAVSVFSVVKHAYARPRPLGLGGIVPSSYSFPSGHSTAAAAVCATLSYVYWREGFTRRSVALAVAVLVPLIVGFSRIYLNVHWATDVLGGWSAGVVIAVLSITLYDHNRRRRRTDSHVIPSHTRSGQ